MQKLRLTCINAKVEPQGVTLEGITVWDPPQIDLERQPNDVYEGHGVPDGF
jgi:hypothetical protein